MRTRAERGKGVLCAVGTSKIQTGKQINCKPGIWVVVLIRVTAGDGGSLSRSWNHQIGLDRSISLGMHCYLEPPQRLSKAPIASEPKQSSENQPAEIPIMS